LVDRTQQQFVPSIGDRKLLTAVPACLSVCRIGLCFVAIFVLWDMKPVFYTLWKPLDWLVGYTDPRKGPQDRLHGE
jgi:hypothetical protein